MSSSVYEATSCGFGLAYHETAAPCHLAIRRTRFQGSFLRKLRTEKWKLSLFPGSTLNFDLGTGRQGKLKKKKNISVNKLGKNQWVKMLLDQRQAGYGAYA